MKSNDIIKPFEQSLFVQFGTTGELRGVSTLRLDQGVTFSRDGNAIEARYHDAPAAPILVERFSSDSLASTAFQQLQAAVARYARFRRWSGFGKGIVKWGVAPFSLVIFALAMNMAATRAGGDGGVSLTGAPGSAPMVPLPPNLGTPQAPAAAAAAQRPVTASPAQLARAMADGAKSGKYTVQRSKGTKGTLYVFTDPLCQHCQDFEPELDRLARDYTIYLFPVSVIGGEASRDRTTPVLCQKKPGDRLDRWQRAVKEDWVMTACPDKAALADGAAAVAANDQFFRVMGFAGTPAIINAAGEQVPETISNTAAAIDQWMSGRAVAQK